MSKEHKSRAHNFAWIALSIILFIAITWTAFYFDDLLTCPMTGLFESPSTCEKPTEWTGAPLWITYFVLFATIAAALLRNLNEAFEDEG